MRSNGEQHDIRGITISRTAKRSVTSSCSAKNLEKSGRRLRNLLSIQVFHSCGGENPQPCSLTIWKMEIRSGVTGTRAPQWSLATLFMPRSCIICIKCISACIAFSAQVIIHRHFMAMAQAQNFLHYACMICSWQGRRLCSPAELHPRSRSAVSSIPSHERNVSG
jgi:hypothetical protein